MGIYVESGGIELTAETVSALAHCIAREIKEDNPDVRFLSHCANMLMEEAQNLVATADTVVEKAATALGVTRRSLFELFDTYRLMYRQLGSDVPGERRIALYVRELIIGELRQRVRSALDNLDEAETSNDVAPVIERFMKSDE